ncbi:MAG: hypothetical protein K0T99_04765, partial [Alphaproteobacteria bacterium]|nr:hypothetical protein [Alphaproteobacteria bacterium]
MYNYLTKLLISIVLVLYAHISFAINPAEIEEDQAAAHIAVEQMGQELQDHLTGTILPKIESTGNNHKHIVNAYETDDHYIFQVKTLWNGNHQEDVLRITDTLVKVHKDLVGEKKSANSGNLSMKLKHAVGLNSTSYEQLEGHYGTSLNTNKLSFDSTFKLNEKTQIFAGGKSSPVTEGKLKDSFTDHELSTLSRDFRVSKRSNEYTKEAHQAAQVMSEINGSIVQNSREDRSQETGSEIATRSGSEVQLGSKQEAEQPKQAEKDEQKKKEWEFWKDVGDAAEVQKVEREKREAKRQQAERDAENKIRWEASQRVGRDWKDIAKSAQDEREKADRIKKRLEEREKGAENRRGGFGSNAKQISQNSAEPQSGWFDVMPSDRGTTSSATRSGGEIATRSGSEIATRSGSEIETGSGTEVQLGSNLQNSTSGNNKPENNQYAQLSDSKLKELLLKKHSDKGGSQEEA